MNGHLYESCTGTISEALGGSCPICLLRGVLDGAPPAPKSPSRLPRLPDYQFRRRIGEGGMGEVWEARQISLERTVAVKLIKGGTFASEEQVQWFLREAKHAAQLRHAGIVAIHEVDEHEGLHYFTMDLMKGGSLADRIERFRGKPRCAAELVETIAGVVHFSHQHGILHCDLNPANILLDIHDKPYVADFGIAIPIDKAGATQTGIIAGKPAYMAPEQAKGGTRGLTTATDVYGLGTILYELLAGRPPFGGETTMEILEQVIDHPPEDPRKVDSTIDRDLATICLRCLEKDRAHRYRSAEDLALTLRKYLNGEPIGRVGRAEQAWRWCLRHPMATGLIIALGTFLVTMTASVVSLARGQEAAKRAQITQVNMNSAAMVAGTVLSQLRALSDAVERVASQKELAQALENGDDAALHASCMSASDFYEEQSHGLSLNGNSPFAGWSIYDEKGVMRARAPKGKVAVGGRNYEWRNYFNGAWHLAGKGLTSTYVSRAFKGEMDGIYWFTISAPIFGGDHRPIGVLVASVPTAENLGSLVVRDPQSIAVLVAPRDRERAAPEPESTHLVLLHPDYTRGETTPIENAQVQKLDEATRDAHLRIERPLGLPPPDLMTWSDDYEDPVAIKYPKYAGRWLAGFAPVGNTGFVVIVQTHEDAALQSEKKLGWRLATWAGISVSPGILVMLLAAWYEKRRTARRVRAHAEGHPC